MKTIEFQTELHGMGQLDLPPEIASQLPEAGRAKVILMVEEDSEDSEWRKASYEKFISDDSPEDSVYDKYR